jgi:hypothetical protein
MRHKITESFTLLHGPYSAPRCHIGDVLTCELRDRDAEAGGMSAGLIQWPTAKTNVRRSLILCGDLVRAVRIKHGRGPPLRRIDYRGDQMAEGPGRRAHERGLPPFDTDRRR